MKPKRIALVTGAGSGIGRATAIKYAKLGLKVALAGPMKKDLEEVLSEMIRLTDGPTSDFLVIEADFGKTSEIETVVSKTIEAFGGLDILVNGASYSGRRCALSESGFIDDFMSVLQINLMAAIRLSQLVTPHLIKTKGVIINISAEDEGVPNLSCGVSRAGLSMLTKTLANALEGTSVRVISVSPLRTATDLLIGQQDQARPLDERSEDELSNTIVFLTSEKAGYIHGCTMDVAISPAPEVSSIEE